MGHAPARILVQTLATILSAFVVGTGAPQPPSVLGRAAALLKPLFFPSLTVAICPAVSHLFMPSYERLPASEKHADRWPLGGFKLEKPTAAQYPVQFWTAGGARKRCRKLENASQLSNMRSPMRRKVSCSKRPARAFRPNADSAMRSNA